MSAAFPSEARTRGGRRTPEYAGFLRRMGADALDNLLLLPILSSLAPTTWPTQWTAAGLIQAAQHSVSEDPWGQCAGLLLALVYSVFFWVRYLGTPGKLLCHCHLVDAQTFGPLTIKQSLLRNLGYFVSWGTLGLGFLWIIWDKHKQGFHDKIAGSVVLYVPRLTKRGGA